MDAKNTRGIMKRLYFKEDKTMRNLIATCSTDSYFEALKIMERLEKSGFEPKLIERRNRRFGTMWYTITI